MKNISNLLEGAGNHQSVLLEQTRGLTKKWEGSGLLEGINKPTDRAGMSVLLENQARQLIDEASAAGSTGNSEEWAGVALPLVRRVFGEIAAKEFVSVQPMNLPSGLVFYLDFTYGTDQPGHRADGKSPFQNSSLFGGTGNAEDRVQTDEGGLYGPGRFGYTINEVSTSTIASPTNATASWVDLNMSSTYSASMAAGEVHKVTIAKSNFTRADYEGVRAFQISGSGQYTASAYLPEFTTTDLTNVHFFVSASVGQDITNVVVQYHRQPTDSTRGDFEDSSDGTGTITDLDIPQVNLEMKSEPIVAKTKKLKAVWTPELAQDLNAYHSVDAEAELTSMLSEYISLEIDLEILDMLIADAQTVDYWSAKVGYEWNALTNSFVADSNSASASAYQKNNWFQTLGIKLNKVSNKIHKLTMRGGANFLVAGPDICTILESMPGFNVQAGKDAMQFAAGVTAVGALANRYTVYKNPYMTENVLLMGYKGSSFLETGAVYAPYVPLILTPLVYDPTNFTPRRGVMTRYAKLMVRPEFYGKVYVGDLDKV